jgi:hypothetical protein
VATREKNSPAVAHACRKRRLKRVLGAWGYNWAAQSPGDINMETWSSGLGVGRGADNPTPEKNYCHETFRGASEWGCIVREAKAHPEL